jgi:hypothetical protein
MGMKCFAFDTVVREIETAVGEYAIHVESQQTNAGEPEFPLLIVHMTPARNRS